MLSISSRYKLSKTLIKLLPVSGSSEQCDFYLVG